MQSGKLRYLIRDGVAADIQRCLDMDHTYETDYVWQVSLRGEPHELTVDLREARLPRQMDATHPTNAARLRYGLAAEQCFLVAAADADVYGYLVMTREPFSRVGTLHDIVVHVDYRQQGIGLRLLGVAVRWAAQHDLTRIQAAVATKNYPAVRLLQRAGYGFSGFNDQYFDNQDIAIYFNYSLR